MNSKKGAKTVSPTDFTPDRGKAYRKDKSKVYGAIKDVLMGIVTKGKK